MKVILYFVMVVTVGVTIRPNVVDVEPYSSDMSITSRADTVNKSCLECHEEQMQHKVKHVAAILDCKNCHESTKATHPSSNVGFKLKAPVPQLCYTCHTHIPAGKNVHPPVQEGKCLDCHNPHSSPNKRLWREPTSGDLCLKCHTEKLDLASKNMLHKPVAQKECHLCHNPHSTNTEKFLKSDVPKLCLKCHKDKRKMMKMDHVHPPFSIDCRICHEPHGSKEPNLRRVEVVPLCTMCHPLIGMQIRTKPVLHKAVMIDKKCVNCHSPHASPYDKQLLGEVVDVCLKCHNDPIQGESRNIPSIGKLIDDNNHVHGAITKNGCTACHNPHAEERNRLLKKEFSINEYVPGKRESFDLCFSCHDPALLETEKTTTKTNFRKEDKNLHFIHVNREEKGRNCKLCHNIHGSPNEHIINVNAQFGNWQMPLNYEHTETGGSCMPGCHERRGYSRRIVIESLDKK